MEANPDLAEAFQVAFDSHCAGELEQAEALYRMILDVDPGQPDALHFLGVLLHQRDGHDSALEMIRQSIALAPGQADWHNNLGNILTARGELEQAAAVFSQAIALKPHDALPWNNLGAVQQQLGQLEAAERTFRQAIAISPIFADALNNLGNLLDAQGHELEAAEYFCRAYVLEPTQGKQKSMLGVAYYRLGRYAEAAEVYRQWLLEEPDNPVPAHFLAASSGTNIPDRASNAYIEKTFDEFAARFDEHLAQLAYRGPEMIAQALARIMPPGRQLNTLDAGCGTGLCGMVLAPYASRLTGVDLSAQMLEAARQRNIYYVLEKADLMPYLQAHADSFELIAAADTLIYFGDLNPLFAAAHGALQQDGLLAFTIEHDSERHDGFSLNPNGRYSHGRDYLEAALRAHGFNILGVMPGVLRIEFGTPVHGLAVTARKR